MDYLTDEDYIIAEKNGISHQRAYDRFYINGWDKQRAITQPLKKVSIWEQYRDKCESHGIAKPTFYYRINNGLSPEEAATFPLVTSGSYSFNQQPRLQKEWLETAKKNGIGRSTLDQRIYILKWDIQRAITQPVDASKRRKRG